MSPAGSSTRALPGNIKPMLARLTRHPFDSPNHIFELKWDGIRTLVFIEDGDLRLQARNMRNITASFPETDGIRQSIKSDRTVLDGELVCFDKEGRPSFAPLQKRLRGLGDGSPNRGPRARFVAFDLLYMDGKSVMDEPLANRKNMLHEILEPTEVVQACQFIERDGKAFFEVTRQHELEGIVAKDKASRYLPGKRSPDWHKIKRLRECDVVIGGYDFGWERGLLSSLIVGLYDDRGRFTYAGQVGVGSSKHLVRQLHSSLQALHTVECPFENPPRIERFVYWCKPEIVCRVQYGEFTNQGKLRYATYVGQTEDKSPVDCRVDDAIGWPSRRD